MMEIIDGMPSLSSKSKHPWLVAQNMETDGNQFFYTVNDPMSHYRCQIPELIGRRIRACFHGWVILTDHPHDHQWYLWNPLTSKLIRLPPLKLKDGYKNNTLHCCLTSPPDAPGSILIVTRLSRPDLIICRLDRKRKRLRWTELPYSKQLISLTGSDGLLANPFCWNGKLYAKAQIHSDMEQVIVQVDIVAKEKQDVISLLTLVRIPNFNSVGYTNRVFIKATCVELFAIIVGITKEKPVDVYLYKLDMKSIKWVEIKDLKNTVFFVDLAYDDSDLCMPVDCSPAISSKLGSYVHIIHESGKIIHSYDIKDKSISVSSMHCLDLPPRSEINSISRISVWAMPESRLQGDDGNCKDDPNLDEEIGGEMVVVQKNNESLLLEVPCDVMGMIMEFCVGIEYLHFRATCKYCRLAAPVSRCINNNKLQTYSLVSPWLMVFDKDEGIITFTDPMFGDEKYFLKPSPQVFYDKRIWCSRYGWLLLFIDKECPALFNPFTNDIHELPPFPPLDFLNSFCFSAPPTSPDCVVVGFSASLYYLDILIHFVGGEPSWQRYRQDFGDADVPIWSFQLSMAKMFMHCLTRESMF